MVDTCEEPDIGLEGWCKAPLFVFVVGSVKCSNVFSASEVVFMISCDLIVLPEALIPVLIFVIKMLVDVCNEALSVRYIDEVDINAELGNFEEVDLCHVVGNFEENDTDADVDNLVEEVVVSYPNTVVDSGVESVDVFCVKGVDISYSQM